MKYSHFKLSIKPSNIFKKKVFLLCPTNSVVTSKTWTLSPMKEQNREASWLGHVLNHICSNSSTTSVSTDTAGGFGKMNLIMCLCECSKI